MVCERMNAKSFVKGAHHGQGQDDFEGSGAPMLIFAGRCASLVIDPGSMLG